MKRIIQDILIKFPFLFSVALVGGGLVGCSSSGTTSADKPAMEKGLHGTVAYSVQIESDEPGTKIEVNNQSMGVAPLTVKVFGDKDGTFHNFGSDEFIVRGYPSKTNQFPQTKIFKTGAFGIKDDKIPQRIYFNFAAEGGKPAQ